MIAQVREHPVVLCLQEMMGERATANNLIDVADGALKRKSVNTESILAVCTDNPTTMKAFRRLWIEKYPWIIVSALISYAV
jgi:hypothetical protein